MNSFSELQCCPSLFRSLAVFSTRYLVRQFAPTRGNPMTRARSAGTLQHTSLSPDHLDCVLRFSNRSVTTTRLALGIISTSDTAHTQQSSTKPENTHRRILCRGVSIRVHRVATCAPESVPCQDCQCHSCTHLKHPCPRQRRRQEESKLPVHP